MTKRICTLLLCLLLVLTMIPICVFAEQTPLKIIKQPTNGYAAEGKTAKTSVVAQGDDLTYQWYLKKPQQDAFIESSITKSTYAITMTAKKSGRQVYCVITDRYGNSVTTDTVTLKIPTALQIIEQPVNAYAAEGVPVKTSFTAQGDELQYQWYYKNSGQKKFHKSSLTGNTYSVSMTPKRVGKQVYCVVTDCHGNSVTTDTVTLDLPPAIMITSQPADTHAFMGETAAVSFAAKGEELQYQWYFKNAQQSRFYKSSVTGDTYPASMTSARVGMQIYCVITDNEGNTTQTRTATLRLNGAFQKDLFKVKPQKTRNLAADLAFFTDDALVWESSDPSIATVDANGMVTGIKEGTVTITVTDKANHKAQCKVKVCDLKQVALTFDDGPSPHTKRLLDFLKENDVPVTFFVVGNRMNSYSKTLRRAVDEGHEIGYHSYSHKTQTNLSDDRIISDFEKSNELLKSLTGAEFTLWRTPGGNYDQQVLDCVPLPHIMWSVDPRDWKYRNSYSVYSSVINSSDGAIILLHDLYDSTVDGAIRALEKMLEEDYEFLTVTELLSRDGNPPEPHTTYYHAD